MKNGDEIVEDELTGWNCQIPENRSHEEERIRPLEQSTNNNPFQLC